MSKQRMLLQEQVQNGLKKTVLVLASAIMRKMTINYSTKNLLKRKQEKERR